MISVRPLREGDVDAADRIMRLAFGTFVGMPDPEGFMGDAGFVRTRWAADPESAFGAYSDGELIGSNVATNWGSVGFFGPLTVHPEHWGRGVGSRLMEPVLARFDEWGLSHAGLFTFAQSAKHVGLYQKFGFWPRFLTAVLARPVRPGTAAAQLYSQVAVAERAGVLDACRAVTDAIYPGFDLAREILATEDHGLGDTVLLLDDATVVGLAVCHCGPGTEAGGDTCYVKVGAVASGPDAGARFGRLLDGCEALAASRGLATMNAGVNLGRHEAYRALLDRGYRTFLQGVAMERGNRSAYNRGGVYLIDDWR